MPTSIKSYSLTQVRGLTAAEVSKLKKAGIDSTGELLAATKSTYAEQKLAKSAGITLDRMREAVNRADLMQVSGMGPASADLFENAGVNSAKELAQRNPAALAQVLAKYVKSHPELNYRLPSPTTVASLVAKAKALSAPVPTPPAVTLPVSSMADAVKLGEAELNKYIDDVLFNEQNPAGNAFREMCLWSRPKTEWAGEQQKMHDEVHTFFTTPRGATTDTQQVGYDAQEENATQYVTYGRMYGLYTEVVINKATGKPDNVLVEVD